MAARISKLSRIVLVASLVILFPSLSLPARADDPGPYERYLLNVICAKQHCLGKGQAPQDVEEYVATVFGRLIRASSIPSDERVGFFITLERAPNAWALKHYTGFTAGLLLMRLTSDEFAFVVAHELGHIELGHYESKLNEISKYYAIAFIAAIISQGNYNPLNDPYFVLIARLGLAAFSREQESQADLRGLQIMRSAGFYPWAAISALRKIDPLGLGGTGDLFADHPSTAQRIDRLQTESANFTEPIQTKPGLPPPESSTARPTSGAMIARSTNATQQVGDIQYSIHLDSLTFSGQEDVRIRVGIRNDGNDQLTIKFPTGQDYMYIVRNEAGAEIFRSSHYAEFNSFTLSRGVDFPLDTIKWGQVDQSGNPLAPGRYELIVIVNTDPPSPPISLFLEKRP